MPRANMTYDIAQADTHDSATSTGTANVQTITAPASANACMVSAETNGARLTFDGGTPDATNGLMIAAGGAPLFIPLGRDIKFVSQAAANSVVHVLWLS